jgi:hypothetical protein
VRQALCQADITLPKDLQVPGISNVTDRQRAALLRLVTVKSAVPSAAAEISAAVSSVPPRAGEMKICQTKLPTEGQVPKIAAAFGITVVLIPDYFKELLYLIYHVLILSCLARQHSI